MRFGAQLVARLDRAPYRVEHRVDPRDSPTRWGLGRVKHRVEPRDSPLDGGPVESIIESIPSEGMQDQPRRPTASNLTKESRSVSTRST